MKHFALLSCAGILSLGVVSAQETSTFSADFGGGFTTPVGTAGRNLDIGWDVPGGVGYNFSSRISAKLNLGFDDMGVNSSTLSTVDAPSGDIHIFQATIDPMVHLVPKGRFDFYLTGGGGIFHRYQEFTQPTCDWDRFQSILRLLSRGLRCQSGAEFFTVTKPGFDVGAGVAGGAIDHAKFFSEAKWDHMFLNRGHTDFIPVTFGFAGTLHIPDQSAAVQPEIAQQSSLVSSQT